MKSSEFIKNGGAVIGGDKIGENTLCSYGAALLNSYNDEDPEITYFAWRNNTGVKPEFDGMVHIECKSGSKHLGRIDDFKYWWTDGTIEKWRPHLPSIPTETEAEKLCLDAIGQKSPYDVGAHVSDASKPVFTKEMADAGDTVKVGMVFATEVGRRYCADMVNSKSVCFTDEDGFLVGMPIGRAKPIQTEREKAISELSDEFYAMSCLHDRCQRAAVATVLYDAGYRLTTPPKQG